MKSDESAQLVRTGAFVMVAIALLFAAIVLLGRSQALFTHRIHLHAWFENTSGLVVGAPVRLGGVDVGIVESIRFDADPRERKVRVNMAVERRYVDRIRGDSLARLTSKGLLGDMIINITVGSAEAAPLSDGATLRAGESEGLTEVLGSLQDGIGQIRSLSAAVQERLRALVTDDLARDVGRIAHATAGVVEGIERGPGLAHGLIYDRELGRQGAALIADAHRAAVDADRAITRIDGLVAEVEHGSGTLHGLVYRDDGGKLLATLERSAGDLDRLIVEVRSGRGLLHELVYDRDRVELLTNLTALSRTLKQVGDDVHAGKGTVGALIEDPSLYEDLKSILGNLKRNKLLRWMIRQTIKDGGMEATPLR